MPTTNIPTEEFARYEFKYLLNAQLRKGVEDEISHFMKYDGHVHKYLHNSYFVRSLYFDNAYRTHYYEKIDGVGVRKKFRLRTYARQYENKEDVPIYLEEKGRNIERIYKHRVVVDPGHLEIFHDHERHIELLEIYPGVDIVERFCFSSIRRAIRPQVIVDYIRRPYTSSFDMNFRITFDSQISAAGSNIIFPHKSTNWNAIYAGGTILEVKFNRRIPPWFHRIIQAYSMRRISVSKFCKGMEACNLVVDLS